MSLEVRPTVSPSASLPPLACAYKLRRTSMSKYSGNARVSSAQCSNDGVERAECHLDTVPLSTPTVRAISLR